MPGGRGTGMVMGDLTSVCACSPGRKQGVADFRAILGTCRVQI